MPRLGNLSRTQKQIFIQGNLVKNLCKPAEISKTMNLTSLSSFRLEIPPARKPNRLVECLLRRQRPKPQAPFFPNPLQLSFGSQIVFLGLRQRLIIKKSRIPLLSSYLQPQVLSVLLQIHTRVLKGPLKASPPTLSPSLEPLLVRRSPNSAWLPVSRKAINVLPKSRAKTLDLLQIMFLIASNRS